MTPAEIRAAVTVYLYDPTSDSWPSIDSPFPDDVAEAMLASARAPGCTCRDGGIEYGWRCSAPDVAIVHQRDCAA